MNTKMFHGHYLPHDYKNIIMAHKIEMNNIIAAGTLQRPYKKRRNGWGHGGSWGKKRRHERKPKLWNFFQSCGLLDQDKVMRMSDGELAEGAVDVMRYASHDLSNHARGFCEGMAQAGRGTVELGKCACGIVKCTFNLISSIFD